MPTTHQTAFARCAAELAEHGRKHRALRAPSVRRGSLFDASGWFARRDENMAAARACLAALTDPKGGWRFGRNDPRVTAAVGKWVARARRANRIALGFTPLCDNFYFYGSGIESYGPVYAGRAA